MPGSALWRRSTNGAIRLRSAASASAPAAVPDVVRVPVLELALGAEQARVRERHQAPQLTEVVLDRGTGDDEPVRALELAGGLRRRGRRVLDRLRLVEHDPVPLDLAQRLVAAHHAVARDHDVRGADVAGRVLAGRPVVQHHAQLRREPLGLAEPVRHDRGRRDDERRRLRLLLRRDVVGDDRERLRGLPEAHVVGQDAAELVLLEPDQPRQPVFLVVAQRRGDRLRRLDLLGRGRLELAGERAADPTRDGLDVDLVRGRRELEHVGGGLVPFGDPLRERQRRRARLFVDAQPAAAHGHELAAGAGEHLELFGGERVPVDQDLTGERERLGVEAGRAPGDGDPADQRGVGEQRGGEVHRDAGGVEGADAVLEQRGDGTGRDDELVGRLLGQVRPRAPGDVPLAREQRHRVVRRRAEQVGGVRPEGREHDGRVGERLEAGEEEEVAVEVVRRADVEPEPRAGAGACGDLVGPAVHLRFLRGARERRRPEARGREIRDRGGEPAVQHLVGVAVGDGFRRREPDLADRARRTRSPAPAARTRCARRCRSRGPGPARRRR